MSEEKKLWWKDKEEIERMIRLAYVMGVHRQMYVEAIDVVQLHRVSGDDAMFAVPREAQVDMIAPTGEDIFRLGKVTPKDVGLILKVVYGDDYDYFMARGRRLRKKARAKKARRG